LGAGESHWGVSRSEGVALVIQALRYDLCHGPLPMFEDLRSAVRSVSRARGLAAMLVLSLALGTGANAAVLGTVYGLLFRAPAGVERPEALVSIYTSEFSGAPYGRTSLPDFRSIGAAGSLEAAAAVDDSSFVNAEFGTAALRVRTAAITTNYFDLLGMVPYAGRLLRAEDSLTSPRAAVISATLAETFGGRDAVIGRELRAGGEDFLVVGVAPPKFRGLQASRVTDLWVPLRAAGDEDRGDRRFFVVARRTTDLANVAAALSVLHQELARAHPTTNRGAVTDAELPRRFTALAYSSLEPGTRSRATIVAAVVVGAVALLLLSACVNAGTLLLSRATGRRRELAVRMALGASRGRLIRQLLAESLLVSLAGGACGLLFAQWIMSAIPALFAPEHAELLDTRIDLRLILITIGIAAGAGALFGIAPALQGTGAPASLALRADAGGISEQHGSTWVRGLLITAQLALSTLLLITTGLLIGSLAHALRGDFGFAARDVAVIGIQNPGGNCTIYDSVRGSRFQQRVFETLPKTAGIRAVGWAATPPLGRGPQRQFSVETGATLRERVDLNVNIVSAGYFRAMGVPLIEGRPFGAADGARAERAVVIDELVARRYFGIAATGRHLIDADGERLLIVGVVRSGRYRTMQDSPQPTVYLPLSQEHAACGSLVVRTDGDPAALLPLIQERISAVDGGVTITRATTLDAYLNEALTIDRLTTTLVGMSGVIALLMGVGGVYGAMNDAVVKRTREIGLRIALGAGRPQLAWLVFSEALYLTGAGVVLGVLASLTLERVAATFVYGLPAVDPMTLATTPAILSLVVILAAIVPLRRALAVSPIIALRVE
jgi:predicted permease